MGGGQEIIFYPTYVQTGPVAHTNSGLLLGARRLRPTPSKGEVANEELYLPPPPHVFMASYRVNSTLTYVKIPDNFPLLPLQLSSCE